MKNCLFLTVVLLSSFLLKSSPSFSTQTQALTSDIQHLLELSPEINPAANVFYQERNYMPYWLDKPDALNEFTLILKSTPRHGLPIERYEFDKILKLKSSDSSIDLAKLDLLLTEKFLLYAKDLSHGIVDPTSLTSFINIEPKTTEAEKFLSELNESPRIKKFLEETQPNDPDYIKLQLELQRLLAKDKTNQVSNVPIETTLELGMSHPNILSLRKKLKSLEYLYTDNESETFDEELHKTVMLFQEDSGLNADGVVGRKTIQALNIPIETRIVQVLVNLERIRWLNFDKGPDYVIVNQPNYEAKLIKENNTIWESNVVIGLPDFQTAEFFDQMTHIIVNPTWHVPKSIAVDEYLPKIQEDPEFLINNEMNLYVRGTTKIIDPNLIDMSVFTVDNFPFEIKQNPGNINALGKVKFMFPNKFSIYMHDTPMKPLFSKDLRAFSHGCVRVERPFKFANALLSDDENIENSQFYSALKNGEETQLNLPQSIPVYLIYRTVIVDDFGTINYRPDIYGRDALLYMSLISSGLNIDV